MTYGNEQFRFRLDAAERLKPDISAALKWKPYSKPGSHQHRFAFLLVMFISAMFEL